MSRFLFLSCVLRSEGCCVLRQRAVFGCSRCAASVSCAALPVRCQAWPHSREACSCRDAPQPRTRGVVEDRGVMHPVRIEPDARRHRVTVRALVRLDVRDCPRIESCLLRRCSTFSTVHLAPPPVVLVPSGVALWFLSCLLGACRFGLRSQAAKRRCNGALQAATSGVKRQAA